MSLSAYEATWVRYFAFTTAVEMAVAVPLIGKGVHLGRRVASVLVANFSTHPLVWFFLARLGMSRLGLTVVAESWALGFETVVYALAIPGVSRSRALAISALANGASFALGTLSSNWL